MEETRETVEDKSVERVFGIVCRKPHRWQIALDGVSWCYYESERRRWSISLKQLLSRIARNPGDLNARLRSVVVRLERVHCTCRRKIKFYRSSYWEIKRKKLEENSHGSADFFAAQISMKFALRSYGEMRRSSLYFLIRRFWPPNTRSVFEFTNKI